MYDETRISENQFCNIYHTGMHVWVFFDSEDQKPYNTYLLSGFITNSTNLYLKAPKL